MRLYHVGLTCLVLLATLLPILEGFRIKRVVKHAKNRGRTRVRIVFERDYENEEIPVSWTDQNGQRLYGGQPRNYNPQNNRWMDQVFVNGDVTQVTATIGTGMDWISLTINAARTKGVQKRPEIPHVAIAGDLIYPAGSTATVEFQVEHPPLGDNYDDRFSSLPLYITANIKGYGNLVSQSLFDAGYFSADKPEKMPKMPKDKYRTIITLWPYLFGPSSGLLSAHYTEEYPDKLITSIKVYKARVYGPDNQPSLFNPEELLLLKDFSAYGTEVVNCYNPNVECRVSCFAASGDPEFEVSLSISRDGEYEELVSMANFDGEQVAQVEFPGLPAGDSTTSEYRCETTAPNRETQSKAIKLNFRTLAQIDTANSLIEVQSNGDYKAVCEIHVFPQPTVTFTFKFSDSSLNQEMAASSLESPHWQRTRASAILENPPQAALTGVRCKVGGSTASYTIPYEE